MANVAANSAVDPQAKLADDVHVGPFCVVGPDAIIHAGTRLENGVTITGRVTIGPRNVIHAGAVIGGPPQDLSFSGADTQVIIGEGNIIREGVTINRGSDKEDGITSIGNHCFLMANCHVAHDCHVRDRVVVANGTLLAGHVHVHDDVTLSGNLAVHHFATIGAYSFVGGLSRVTCDIPPYMLAEGHPARPRCVNIVALKRNDFPPHVIKALQEAYRIIFRGKTRLDEARELLRSRGHMVPQVNHLLSFLETQQEGRHGRARERLRRIAA